MKFAKVLEQTLVEEDIPQEWVEAAIQYKALKKCINKVVKELRFLGLEQNVLKLLLEDPKNQNLVELSEDETTPHNPVLAEYTLVKSNSDGLKGNIQPMLKISINYDDENVSDAHIDEVGLDLKRKLEAIINQEDSSDTDTGDRILEIKEEGDDLVLSPQTSHIAARRSASPEPEPIEELKIDDTIKKEPEIKEKKIRTKDIFILLNSDTKFFQMLDSELKFLDKIKTNEEKNLMHEVEAVADVVSSLANPKSVSDLYKWRELFRIYLDTEVYFKYNQITSAASERSIDQVKANMELFVDRVNKSGVMATFKGKKSLKAFEMFIAMNFHLLKVQQYQSINSEAFRKILKKFDKQTSLNIKDIFPKLINDDHIFFTGASLAQSICFVIQNAVLSLVPQLDDYTCPICMSIAFKPIKLQCGHVFCVRCLVKMKQQDKNDCPICRYSSAVTLADSSNLDLETMQLMKSYFPKEVKEKLKERDKERYNEVVGDSKCITM